MDDRPAEPVAISRPLSICLFALIVALFAVRNLPWHLDNFDQAKQAFVSFEMVEQGDWWFQHTPAGRVATKPPLAGWMSAALYFLQGGHGWELAWRLPPFACAIILLALLWKNGRAIGGELAAFIAAGAFGFNLMAPRLATLVRTDMMLTLFIFLAGWLTLEKVRSGTAWTPRERLGLALAVLGSMLTKGPILYAFLLPGLAAYAWLARRRGLPNHAWAGWLPWFAPLAGFALWVGIGVWLSDDFFNQVVLKEFLGRFDMGDNPVHKHQPVWFYLTHLVHKWAPWSLALLALCCSKRWRSAIRNEPALLWLACWAVGGFIFMSLVPSKRPDRIFPVIPPLCLLVAALAHRWALAVDAQRRWRCVVLMAALAALISGGYAMSEVVFGFREDARAVVRFGARVREITAAHPDRLAVVGGGDEGLLLYTGQTRFARMGNAVQEWRSGRIDWMLLQEEDWKEHEAELSPTVRLLELPKIKDKRGPYLLLGRPASS